MDGILIATTQNSELQSLGTGGQRKIQAWDQIAGYLRRNLSPAHAALFAEPNQDSDRGVTDWYADGNGEATKLSSLPEAQRISAQSELDRLTADVRTTGERLRQSKGADDRFLGEMLGLALVIPSEDFVRIVGAQPVLIAWAHTFIGQAAQPELLIGAVAARSRVTSGAGQAPMQIVGPPVLVRRGPWVIFFSSLFATLLILLLAAFLYLLDPFHWFAVPIAQCVVPPNSFALQEEMRNEQRRESEMRDEIARVSLELGNRRTACPPIQAPPTAPPQPTPEDRQRQADMERAKKEGGRTGKAQVVLAWDDKSDLDLAVTCPPPGRERIYYNVKSACGGTLDVDKNNGTPTPNPVENIVFEQNPSPGRYEIFVTNYNHPDRSAPVRSPYRVTVRLEGQPDKTFTGDVELNKRIKVGEFEVPAR